jgi:hypothetical protein
MLLEIKCGEEFSFRIHVYGTEKYVILHCFYLCIQTIGTHAAKRTRLNTSRAHKDFLIEKQNNKRKSPWQSESVAVGQLLEIFPSPARYFKLSDLHLKVANV